MGAKLDGLFVGQRRHARLEFLEFFDRANLPAIGFVLHGYPLRVAPGDPLRLRPPTATGTFLYDAPLGPGNAMQRTQGAIRLMRPFASVGQGDRLHFDLDIDNRGPMPDLTVADREEQPDVIFGEIGFIGIKLRLTIGEQALRWVGVVTDVPKKWKLPDLRGTRSAAVPADDLDLGGSAVVSVDAAAPDTAPATGGSEETPARSTGAR